MRLLPLEYAVRNLLRDPARLVQLTLGTALVVCLLLAAGAFSSGMRRTLGGSGDAHNIILLGAGSEGSVERSSLDPSTAGVIAASVAGLRDAGGQAAVSPEIVHMTLVGPADDAARQAVLRGVTAMAFAVHRGVRLVAGRMPHGDEVLVGQLAHHRLGMPEHLLQPGATLMIEGRAFTISGVFAAPDTIFAGELWVDLQALMAATRRSTISSVVVACDSATLDDLETFTLLRLDLELVAISEAAYFADRGRFFAPIRSMAWMTALLIAGGAIFGGLNTFHAAFAARSREAATVQAIGFPRRAVLLSFLSEACLVSVIGTLAATAAAVCLLDGRAVDVPGGTFTLSIDLPTLALGLGVGLVLGPVGALLPAWRCLRPPLPAALRSA